MSSNPRIRRVLVANRGEIAVRVIRACHALGLEAVAVFSEADRGALHTRIADEAHQIGPPPAAQSYLDRETIMELARERHCDAIHPGYGFLAESARFAELVEENGLIFIGPGPEAMRRMGDKLAARQTARSQGVPTVPGIYEPVASYEAAKQAAEEIGYPLLIKAAAGGGGKGMRLVQSEEALAESFERAVSEVEKSFGDPSVYLERYIANAKHIEVQVIADGQGRTAHLFERECSVQRRYQKLIEETPASQLGDVRRREMGEAAVAVAEGCGYRSAGTVEFIFDVDRDEYYFLEMNTRIQVEHPITEETTGIDLVAEQLNIANGKPLSFEQADVQPRGAAIECRIYAEDAEHEFLPSTGRVEELILPSGEGVRIDSGIVRGDAITAHYDPLLMKLIAWGADREAAIAKMRSMLEQTVLVGPQTTVGFHLRALADERFLEGGYTTRFIEGMAPHELSEADRELLAVAAVLKRAERDELLARSLYRGDCTAVWRWAS